MLAQRQSFAAAHSQRRVLQARAPFKAARLVAARATEAEAPATATAVVDDGTSAVKLELLKKVACLDRGRIATSNDRYEVSSFVEVLEEAASSASSNGASAASVNIFDVQGKWELLYSSVEQFRSSPFFWAFQEGLVQNRDIAAKIFKFTDSVPGAHVGVAFQTISFDTGRLISEVDLTVFPGLKGTVITTSSVEPDLPNKLNVTVENTRVANSNLLPFIDNITVPVKEIFEQIRGAGATNVLVEITYLDSDLRVARTRPDNQIFIYRRA